MNQVTAYQKNMKLIVDNMGLGDYDGACETFVLKSLSHWGWIIYWCWQPYNLLGLSYDKNMTTKSASNLLKLNNNQGFSEPLSKQFYFMKAQSIPFRANFEQ